MAVNLFDLAASSLQNYTDCPEKIFGIVWLFDNEISAVLPTRAGVH
jgi:hypothetical protein